MGDHIQPIELCGRFWWILALSDVCLYGCVVPATIPIKFISFRKIESDTPTKFLPNIISRDKMFYKV
jgi:hypothetical protein